MSRGRAQPRPWSQSRDATGAFASVQRTSLPTPAVDHSPLGATRLGDLYWHELERWTRGLVRARVASDAVELTALGIGPTLLRFGPAEVVVRRDSVTCRHAILGGLLARAPGGWISFTQTVGHRIEVRSELTGFFPRLATRRVRCGWSGVLYPHVQARLHGAVGRRYFARLHSEAAR